MSFYYHIVAPVVDVDLQYGVNDLSIGIHKFYENIFFLSKYSIFSNSR